MRGRRAGRGALAVVGLMSGLGLVGCQAGSTAAPSSPTPTPASASTVTAAGEPGASGGGQGQLVAVPGDGSEPGTGMDIGGPGLEQRCVDGDLPLPLDMVASVSCITVPDSFDVTQPMGPALSGVTLDPGTYWVVLVCSGPGGFTFGSAVPGLSAEVEVPCPEDGRAARQKLGTVTDAADGNITGHPSTGGATYAFWLVREGKSTL